MINPLKFTFITLSTRKKKYEIGGKNKRKTILKIQKYKHYKYFVVKKDMYNLLTDWSPEPKAFYNILNILLLEIFRLIYTYN